MRVRLELADALEDEPQIRRLTGREAISELFSFDLEVILPGRRTAEHAGELDRAEHQVGAVRTKDRRTRRG